MPPLPTGLCINSYSGLPSPNANWGGLSHNSMWVYLAVPRAFLPPVDSSSAFTHPTTVCFLKGLLKVFSLMLKPTSSWDLNITLSATLEPLTMCFLFHL